MESPTLNAPRRSPLPLRTLRMAVVAGEASGDGEGRTGTHLPIFLQAGENDFLHVHVEARDGLRRCRWNPPLAESRRFLQIGGRCESRLRFWEKSIPFPSTTGAQTAN